MENSDIKIALSVTEAAKLLSISRPKMYELMRREDFPIFRLGKRILISRKGLENWVQNQIKINAAPDVATTGNGTGKNSVQASFVPMPTITHPSRCSKEKRA